ncbi:O-antigen polysaccharide polymerase Wzy [Pseudocitrobacter vendiensis]|uniref:O-antigen polysaccharide polymerase Wzy n=1 Tax=Pseudocitrobacter vendiensis TaxID=2488306 RepID=A0ABN8T9T6_9ENTR|nr:O-antigen polysaccharide polymerase Wzy [Pseudocitrobacter vendiensis]CAH6636745.1 hypothetical protein FBBNIHIM_07945 [Pseudocitrobacter vendiensis]
MRPLFYFYSILVLIISATIYSIGSEVNISIYFAIISFILLVYFLYKIDGYFSLSVLLPITFGVFIFGRHISYILSGHEIDVYRVGFLSSDILSSNDYNYWTFISTSSIFVFSMLSVFVKNIFGIDYRIYKSINNGYAKKSPIVSLLLFLISVLTAFVFVEIFEFTIRYGYVGIYLYNMQMAENPTLIGKLYFYSGSLLYLLVGYSLVFSRNKNELKIILSLILIKSIFLAVIGQRGPFLCSILFMVLLYTQVRKNNLIKIGALFFSLALLAQVLNLFRGTGQEINGIFDAFSRFFYEQGISFYIPYLSSQYSFPTIASIQTLLPGTKFIYETFSGDELTLLDYNFTNALTYYVNYKAYLEGAGLGWSVLSDFQKIIGGDFGIIIGMAALGLFTGYCESQRSGRNAKFLIYSIAIPFLFLPRASIASITPIILLCFIVMIFREVSKIKTYGWNINER